MLPLHSPSFYQMTTDGCIYCGCDPVGSNQSGCDSNGNCLCGAGTRGEKCDVCVEGNCCAHFFVGGGGGGRGWEGVGGGWFQMSNSSDLPNALSWFRGHSQNIKLHHHCPVTAYTVILGYPGSGAIHKIFNYIIIVLSRFLWLWALEWARMRPVLLLITQHTVYYCVILVQGPGHQ